MSLKFHYKWPTASTKSAQHAILTNQKTGQEALPSNETLGIGIATIIFYFMTFLYIYGSGAINNNNVLSDSETTIDSLKKIGNALWDSVKIGFSRKAFDENSNSIFNLNTLSSSFKGSERIGTTVCLVIFLALLQGVFAYQNIYGTDLKKSTIVAFNYFVVLCWLLFLYIFPSRKKGGTSMTHLFLAICVLVCIIINCFLISNLYLDYFDSKSLEPLSGIGYTLVAVILFSGMTMITNGYFHTHLTHELVAYSEMACLVLFGIFLIIFIQFPPLPTAQLSCSMIPSPSPTSPSPTSPAPSS